MVDGREKRYAFGVQDGFQSFDGFIDGMMTGHIDEANVRGLCHDAKNSELKM